MLQETIDQGYRLFDHYRAERPLDVCTVCCMSVENEGRLAALPVREIPRELLMEYNDSAKPEKTSVDEVKHFLPRYLELISAFEFPTHSAELSFSRLAPLDENEWSLEEKELLKVFSAHFFGKCLTTYPLNDLNRIDSIIIMLWRGWFDVDALLRQWQITESVEAVLHFKDLYFHGFAKHNRKRLSNSFGDEELAEKLNEWMDSDEVKEVFAKKVERVILQDNKLDEQTVIELDLFYEILKTRTSKVR